MKTLGIIGGMGPLATADLYKKDHRYNPSNLRSRAPTHRYRLIRSDRR